MNVLHVQIRSRILQINIQISFQGSAEHRTLCGGGGPGQIVDPLTGNLEEINECKMMPDICQRGTCMNLLGSFRCDCERG